MRKFTQFVLITAAIMAAPSAFAEMKIAVLNYQMGAARVRCRQAIRRGCREEVRPQLNKLKNLERDAKALQDKLVSNGSKMSQGDREKAELDFKQKARDFQFQSKELNESKAAADRDMLKKLKPKLDQAVEETIKKGGYDMVIERGAVVDVKPQYDITRQVIERMNQLR